VYYGSQLPEGYFWGYYSNSLGVSVLTDTALRKAKPKEKPYRMTDGLGLYLTVTPTGGKLWRWKYRFPRGGAEKLMSFGRYPDVSLVEAREGHTAARKLLAGGIDPMAQRKAQRVAAALGDTSSFRSVALAWHEHWKADKSPRHTATVLVRLEGDVFPKFGARSVDEIEAPDLVMMLKAIESRGVRDLPKRVFHVVGMVFRYAIAHGYCKRNPAADIKPGDVLKPARRRNLARVDATALPGLLRAMEVYQGKVVTRLAMKLMSLVFVRTGELIGGRWPEWDRDARRWHIPAERMKMKTPHIVPLSVQATEILELLYTVTGGGELMFPGDVDHCKTMSKNTILEALDRMGYGGIMTGHGFRGLASTLLHEQGWPHEHIELQLAHAPHNAVSAAYNHALYVEPRAKMMQAWSDYLEKLQKKVVSIRGEVA
jgi:integrase